MFGRIATIVAVVVVLWAATARDSGASGPGHTIVVKAGDTLWSIAAANYDGDTRKGVWLIEQRNDLDGTTLRVGDRLVVPGD